MNADLMKDNLWERLLPEGGTDAAISRPTVRKSVLRRVICAVLSAVSLFSYGVMIYGAAKDAIGSDLLGAVTHDVLLFCEKESTVPVVTPDESPVTDAPEVEAEVTDAPGVVPAIVEYPIAGDDLSADDILVLANQTGYSPDTASLAAIPAFARDTDRAGDPLVLIVHTHGTEAYTPDGADTYTAETSFRSSDTSENVVAVGDVIAGVLEDAGIGVIHCEEMFDEESYVESYSRCASAVVRYLSENPSVKYVLDVHRDAIFRGDTLIAPRTADGAAQVMTVCGTDEMGADFPDWEDNLGFALAVQCAADEAYPGMMRNVNLRGASFNEQLAERFLLVEVGSAGNTLAEAKEAGRRFGEVLAGVISPEG